jgi:hypothetical protein
MKFSEFMSILFGAALMIMGVGFIIPASNTLLSQQWPSAAGEVSISRVVYMKSSSLKFGTTTTYSAEIAYQYTVGDRHYTGTNISFNDHSNIDSSLAESTVMRYPTGNTVKVYYNPGDPGEAVLDTGFTSDLLGNVVFGALLSLVGGGFLIFLLWMAFLGWWRNLATRRESPDNPPGALN